MVCLHYDHKLESLSFMSRSLSFIVLRYPNMSTCCLANTMLFMRGIRQAVSEQRGENNNDVDDDKSVSY